MRVAGATLARPVRLALATPYGRSGRGGPLAPRARAPRAAL